MKAPGSNANDALLDALTDRARTKAAEWRGRGVAAGLDRPVHPPAQSELLATYLTAYLGSPLEQRVPPRTLKGRLAHMLLGHERARIDRLMSYAQLLTEDMAKTICQLEIELAELRSRVASLEDQPPVRGPGESPS